MASTRLEGEWVLLGGSVLPLLGIDYRITIDIDLAYKEERCPYTLEVMDLATDLALPVETINQAGSYFLHKIKDFDKHIKILARGKACTIYRPDLYLYLRLKIDRFSLNDYHDCLKFIQYCQEHNELEGFEKALKMLNAYSKKAKGEKKDQILDLTNALKNVPQKKS